MTATVTMIQTMKNVTMMEETAATRIAMSTTVSSACARSVSRTSHVRAKAYLVVVGAAAAAAAEVEEEEEKEEEEV